MFDAPGLPTARDAACNGLPMSSSTTLQRSNVGHVGSHPPYDAIVDAGVSQISTPLQAGQTSPAQARQLPEDLQSDLRKKVQAMGPSIPVAPSATNPCKPISATT
jgi:hypothetical protein